MSNFRKIGVAVLSVAFSFALIGCETGGTRNEHSGADRSAAPTQKDRAKGENPKSEHPKGEYPKAEHPKSK